jgi:hypothetical protein
MFSKFIVECVVFITLITSSIAASAGHRGNSELSVLQKVYDDCQAKPDFTECLKQKAVTAVARAIDMVSPLSNLKINESLTFFSFFAPGIRPIDRWGLPR